MAKQSTGNDITTLRVQDFSGGLNTTVAPALLNPNEAQKADRINYDQKGTIQPQKGRKKRYAAQFDAAPVAGLGAFYTKAGTGSLLAAAGTTVYTDEPHMENIWNTQGDWTAAGTVAEGDLKTDRTAGSLMTTVGPVRQNEVQTITITGVPTGGTFTLTFSGQTTSALAYNVTTLALTNALAALSSIGGASNIVVTGNTGGPWTVEFIGQFIVKDVATMTATPSLTGGTTPSVVVAVFQQGYNTDVIQTTNTNATWNAGTLDKVAAATNQIALTKKGTDFTKTFDSQADWQTGTLTNIDATSAPGDIKVAAQFPSVSVARTSQADFNLGTQLNTDTVANPGSVLLAHQP